MSNMTKSKAATGVLRGLGRAGLVAMLLTGSALVVVPASAAEVPVVGSTTRVPDFADLVDRASSSVPTARW